MSLYIQSLGMVFRHAPGIKVGINSGSKGPYQSEVTTALYQFYTSLNIRYIHIYQCWPGINLFWYPPDTRIRFNTDFGLVYAGYIDWCEMGVTSCPYQPGTGIKLIPMLIPVLITVSDLIYQSNTGNIPASYHQLKTILVWKFFKTYPIPVPTWYLKWNPKPIGQKHYNLAIRGPCRNVHKP